MSGTYGALADRAYEDSLLRSRILLSRNSIRALEARIAALNTLIRDREAKLQADGYFIAVDRDRFRHSDQLAAGDLSLIGAPPDLPDGSVDPAATAA